jgi:hypothetical protein
VKVKGFHVHYWYNQPIPRTAHLYRSLFLGYQLPPLLNQIKNFLFSIIIEYLKRCKSIKPDDETTETQKRMITLLQWQESQKARDTKELSSHESLQAEKVGDFSSCW